MQKHYKVLKPFTSPLIGNALKGDVIFFGTEMARQWVDLGLVKELESETKPNNAKPIKTKGKNA